MQSMIHASAHGAATVTVDTADSGAGIRAVNVLISHDFGECSVSLSAAEAADLAANVLRAAGNLAAEASATLR